MGVLLALAVLPWVADLFTVVNVTYWLISGLLALSLTFIWGVGGVFSFGQTVFFGLAGYAYGVVSLNWPGAWGTVAGWGAGLAVGTLAAVLLGYFMFYGRVSSLAVAIMTLASTLMAYNLFLSTSGRAYRLGQAALGGFNGMQQLPSLLHLDIAGQYWLVLVAAAVVLAVLMGLRQQGWGWVLNAVRVNEERTELLGYDVRRIKLIGFAISGGVAAMAGVFHTSWGNSINPTVFTINQATLVAIWVMVGGRTRLWGAFLGAALIQGLSNYLGTVAQQATPVILGTVLVGIVLGVPEGLAPALERIWQRWFPHRSVFSLTGDPSLSSASMPSDHPPPSVAQYTLLDVRHLRRRFGQFWAVDGVDLTFQAGQAYCLIGPNGAGKSTVFNMLTGRLTPTTGQILYDQEDITPLMPHQRARRGISIKLQVPTIYPELTVYENLWLAAAIRYRDPHQRHAHMARVATDMGLLERLNQPAGQLSHGEKQWLDMGMATVSDPSLLLLDEPTGGMSRGETAQTVAFVRKLAQRSTVIVVEHDMDFVRQLGAHVTVLAQGKVFADGTMDILQHDEEVRRIYLGEPRT
ncbi:MAG: ATP-binding cassette domain-containing protein [Synechococcales cyanobacterium]